MKILNADCYGAKDGIDIFEVDILKHLKSKRSEHPGSGFITMLENYFEHVGSNGRHPCLAFKIMGESLSSFRRWFPDKQLPSLLVQKFTSQLLKALSCAHSCGVLHTGTDCSPLYSQQPQLMLDADIQSGYGMIRNSDYSHLLAYFEREYPDFQCDDSARPSAQNNKKRTTEGSLFWQIVQSPVAGRCARRLGSGELERQALDGNDPARPPSGTGSDRRSAVGPIRGYLESQCSSPGTHLVTTHVQRW